MNGAVETLVVSSAATKQTSRVTALTRRRHMTSLIDCVEVLGTLRVAERQQEVLRVVARV